MCKCRCQNIILIQVTQKQSKLFKEIFINNNYLISEEKEYRSLILKYSSHFIIKIDVNKNKELKKYFKNQNFIILYRYNYLDDCYSCHFEEIIKIRDFINRTKSQNVLVIPNFTETRENNILFSNELKELNYLRFDENRALIAPIEVNIPRYFAIIDSSLILKEIFFLQKNLPEFDN
jgi:hypothetical protein